MKNGDVEINEAVARKILQTVDAGLVCGVGEPIPGQMCVEAAVCYALGLPHGDDPSCVGTAVRAFKIGLNDSAWSSSAARAQGMRALAVAQLGSDVIDQQQFSGLLLLRTIQKLCPVLLRTIGVIFTNEDAKKKLESAAATCEQVDCLKEALTHLARSLAIALALDLALDRDEAFVLMAEIGLGVLVEMKAPGCQWLALCDLAKDGGVA